MFDLDKIVQKITDKITPALQEGKKQAELNMVVQAATQIYCSYVIRGVAGTTKEAVSVAREIINGSK